MEIFKDNGKRYDYWSGKKKNKTNQPKPNRTDKKNKLVKRKDISETEISLSLESPNHYSPIMV